MMPVPVNGWVKAVLQLGPMTVLALGLVWWLTMGLGARLDDHMQQTDERGAVWRFYLRAICLNTADTDAERAICTSLQEHER